MSREVWNILLIDDNPDDRALVKSLLREDQERRYRFSEVETGEAALNHLRGAESTKPHAILLDYHLPDMDAALFLANLLGGEEVLPYPVVILTGSASANTAKAALRAGAQDYVGKGWMTSQSLSRVIENACERWRMAQSLHRQRLDLETSERFCRTIMVSSPDSIKALNLDGEIIRVNPAAVRRWEVADESSLINRKWTEIWPDATRALAEEAINSARQGHTFRFRSKSASLEGSECWWDSIVTPLRDCGSNDITGLLATSRDVTEQKRAEDAAYAAQALAEASSKGKDQFLATLSHELRNPLNPVRLIASDILQSGKLDTEMQDAWQLVLRNVSVQSALIDDLLDLSRITQGKMQLRLQETDAHEILGNALETVRAEREVKRINLRCRLEARNSRLLGDHVRLQQVLWNLLSNAVKFTPEGGDIEVITSNPHPGSIRIVVSDSGAGLNEAELVRIFEPFEQGDHASHGSTNRGGLGLGLAITRQFIEMHDGTVSAESAGKGLGARFVVLLPLIRKDHANQAQLLESVSPLVPTAEPSGHRPMSVLVVEDDTPTRLTLVRLLQKRGYRVSSAASLAEARQVAQLNHFEVLLSDLGLPDGSGHELLDELRRDHNVHIHGIALSGFGMAEDLDASRKAGFFSHIVKPVDLEVLDVELRRLGELISKSQ